MGFRGREDRSRREGREKTGGLRGGLRVCRYMGDEGGSRKKPVEEERGDKGGIGGKV